MINVTKPFLPPAEEYQEYLRQIWQLNWLTNNGPLVNELELKLKDELDLEHLLFLSNGTIALQIAFKALRLTGEVITTPFSYVATTSSLVWEGLKPVFVDIDSRTLNIDVNKIEAAITSDTSAILATHVYGNPCEIDKLEALGKKYGLEIIYDAAHCFGTTYKEKSVFGYGDISTCSFHATKVFHTIEGGAVFSNNPDTISNMSRLRNFGHDGPGKFTGAGINGKNSEFHAAMGLTNLKYIEDILATRKRQYLTYVQKLKNLEVDFLEINPDAGFNYAYCPIIFKSEEVLLASVKALNEHYIFPRRYFYPSLNHLDYVEEKECPIAEDVSSRVLCLPLFHDLSSSSIELISRILLRTQRYQFPQKVPAGVVVKPNGRLTTQHA